jgi:hypothetical protein
MPDQLVPSGAQVPAGPLGLVLDRMALAACRLLDRLRSTLFRKLMPVIEGLISNREHRVVLTGCVAILSSLAIALVLPLWQLALGPILFGTAHVLADVRYCIVRPGFHRRWPLVLCCGLPLVAMMLGQGLDVGLMALAFAFALARGPIWKRMLGLGAVAIAASAIATYGFVADVVFAHLHNVVAVLLWWAWRKRAGRLHWVVLALYIGAWSALLGGALDEVFLGAYGAVADPEKMGIYYHASFLGFGQGEMQSIRWVLAFAMAQSIHYWMWLRMVPEDDRKQYTPRSFRGTWTALRVDMGALFLWFILLSALGTAVWAAYDLFEARVGYLRFVRFHGVMELAAAALIWVEGRDRLLGQLSYPGGRASSG